MGTKNWHSTPGHSCYVAFPCAVRPLANCFIAGRTGSFFFGSLPILGMDCQKGERVAGSALCETLFHLVADHKRLTSVMFLDHSAVFERGGRPGISSMVTIPGSEQTRPDQEPEETRRITRE